MGLSGLEPPTSRLSGVRSNQLSYKPILKSSDFSGDEEIRTLDPLLARQVLSQLSYIPIWSGIHLLSHTVSSAVPSAACVLTVVFGMGTGVSHKRIDTRNVYSVIIRSCQSWHYLESATLLLDGVNPSYTSFCVCLPSGMQASHLSSIPEICALTHW